MTTATPTRCPRCLFVPCLCAEVPVVPTRTKVVIVRHHLERWRTSNTGRLAALALPNSVVIDHGGHSVIAACDGEAGASVAMTGRVGVRTDALGAVPRDGAMLVYPEGPVTTVAPDPPPMALVIIDATWHQTRRMRQRLPALLGLPVLHLAVDAMPAARMRESPGPGRVSTIEAIARALALVEPDADTAALDRLFALAVERMR